MMFPVTKLTILTENLNLEGHLNCCIGSKVTTILLNGWILLLVELHCVGSALQPAQQACSFWCLNPQTLYDVLHVWEKTETYYFVAKKVIINNELPSFKLINANYFQFWVILQTELYEWPGVKTIYLADAGPGSLFPLKKSWTSNQSRTVKSQHSASHSNILGLSVSKITRKISFIEKLTVELALGNPLSIMYIHKWHWKNYKKILKEIFAVFHNLKTI